MTTESSSGDDVDAGRPHEVEVLVVDADTEYLVDLLDRIDRDTEALELHTSQDVEETIARLEDGQVDCLVCSYDPAERAGPELLDYVREHHVDVPVVLLPSRETTIVDSRNLAADIDAVFHREEAIERDVLGPHLVNVVEQRRAAAAADRRSQVTDVMGAVARDIAGAEDSAAVEKAVVERVHEVPAFDTGWVGTVDEEAEDVDPRAVTDEPSAVPGLNEDGPAPPLASAALRSIEYEQPQVVTTGEATYAVVPVLPERGGERALAVSSTSRYAFEEAEVDLLDELGSTLSRTLDTIATREALEQRVDDLELVDELVDGIGVGVVVYGREGTVERANEAFADLVGADPGSLPGTAIWTLLEPRERSTFREHWASVDAEEPTTETASVGGERRQLVTTRVEAEGEPYNVTMVVEGEDAPMDEEFAETLSYEFRHWFDLAREAVEEVRDDGDPEKLELVDQIVGRMHDAVRTEVETVTRPERDTSMAPQLIGEVAGVAWNHVLGEAGHKEVKGGVEVLAHRGLLLRLFEHLFRTLLQYAEAATSVDVGVTADGFYVEDDGASTPHSSRAYAREGAEPSDAEHGAGILVAERAADRMDWSLTMTETENGGTRFEVTGVTFVRRED